MADKDMVFDRPDEWSLRKTRQGVGLSPEFVALILARGRQGMGLMTLKDGKGRVRFMRWPINDGWGVSESRMDEHGNVNFVADYDSAGKPRSVGMPVNFQEPKKAKV